MIRFHKMHGLGNDFVVVDRRDQTTNLQKLLALTDRRRGAGCDQLILLDECEDADLAMEIYNGDGTHVGMCGNAARCVAWWEAKRTGKTRVSIRIGDKLVFTDHATDNAMTVDMGEPWLRWHEIPLAYECDTMDLPDMPAELPSASAVSMGNPHLVFFVPDLDAIDLSHWGPRLEHHPLFPEKTNVSFAQILNPHTLHAKVWERAAGATQACGSAACAMTVSAIRQGLAKNPLVIHYPGGELGMEWTPGSGVRMTGQVAYVFEGKA